jgi:hypothetical protein
VTEQAFDAVLETPDSLPGADVFVSRKQDDRLTATYIQQRELFGEGIIEERGRSVELVPISQGAMPNSGDELLVFVDGHRGYYGTAVERAWRRSHDIAVEIENRAYGYTTAPTGPKYEYISHNQLERDVMSHEAYLFRVIERVNELHNRREISIDT